MTRADLTSGEAVASVEFVHKDPLDPAALGAPLADRVAESASNLALRRFTLTLLAGVTAAVITRLLGPVKYGQYAAAIATWTLLGAAADFGFTLALSRDLPRMADMRRPMLRAAYQVGVVWSVLLAFGLAGLAFAAGLGNARGLSMLVLAPSLLAFGLIPARAVFMVLYRARDMVRVDIGVVVIQSAGMIGVAAAHLGIVVLAGVVSATTALNMLLVAVLARGSAGPQRQVPYGRRRLARRAAPLGLLSVMTQVYLTIDVVIIGWYVSGPSVGEYAAAAKLTTIFTAAAGLVTTAALPAFSAQSASRAELDDIVSRVWHWLVVTALPLFVGLAIFAPLAVTIALGARYGGAVTLLQILALAGVVSVLCNFLGTLMIAIDRTRSLFIQNLLAIAVNVGGNLLLLPRFGVVAAAWLTTVTELLVCAGALMVVGRYVSVRRGLAISARPVAAVMVATAAGVALSRWQVLAATVSALLFVATTTALHAWPAEFGRRLRALRAPRGSDVA